MLSPPRPSSDKDTILVCSLCKYSWRTSYCICSEAVLPKPLSYRNTTTWQDAFENMAWPLNIFPYFFEYSYPTSSLALHSAGNHIPWQERAIISSGISITQIKQHFFFLPRQLMSTPVLRYKTPHEYSMCAFCLFFCCCCC